jgi:putative ABC transport system substrate-binding protein
MRRRDFITLFGGGTLMWPFSVRAEQRAQAQLPKKPVIGVLSPFIDADSTFLRDLRERLAAHGLREGRDIHIEYRSAEGRIDRLSPLAQEFVRLKVDVIVTASAPAIRFDQHVT